MFASKREIGELKSKIESLENKIRLVDRMERSRDQQQCKHEDVGFDCYIVEGMGPNSMRETRLSIKCLSCDKIMRDVGGTELMFVLDAFKV